MNNFIKAWITATCSPESVTSIKDNNKNYLDCVTDEKREQRIFVLSDDEGVYAVEKSYQGLLAAKYTLSFSEAVSKCASLLGLQSYSIK